MHRQTENAQRYANNLDRNISFMISFSFFVSHPMNMSNTLHSDGIVIVSDSDVFPFSPFNLLNSHQGNVAKNITPSYYISIIL